MYAGPIVKTYYSLEAYRRDSALMASYGYQAINIEQLSMTNGLALTLILIFGLLLTPFCIGVVILCFLPLAFSRRWNVSYIPQLATPFPYALPQMMPRPSLPISQPLQPQPYTPASPPSGYLNAPSRQSISFETRVREGFASVRQEWDSWKPWQQALTIAFGGLIAGIAILSIVFIFVLALPH